MRLALRCLILSFLSVMYHFWLRMHVHLVRIVLAIGVGLDGDAC